MRRHPIAASHNELVRIIKGGYLGSHDVPLGYTLFVGGKDRSSDFDGGRMSWSAGNPAWVADLTIDKLMPISMRNANVNLDLVINGIVLPFFKGTSSVPLDNGDGSTNLTVGTPGTALSTKALREYVTYNFATPQQAVQDAVFRVRGYDRSNTRIAEINQPLIVRGMDESADGFEDEATPMDIIASVDEEAKTVEYDTPHNRGFVWIPDPGYGEGISVSWEYDADSDEVLDFPDPEWASPDEQYVEVIVRSRLDDTSATDGVGPGGHYRIWEVWPVFYEHDFPPLDGATHFIDISAEDDPSQQYVADEVARKEARELAGQYSKGQYSAQLEVAFNPLLEPYDVVTVAADREDMSGRYRVLWRGVIDGIEHDFISAPLTRLTLTCALMRSRKIAEPISPVSGVSSGVVRTRVPVEFTSWGDDDFTFDEIGAVTYAELG